MEVSSSIGGHEHVTIFLVTSFNAFAQLSTTTIVEDEIQPTQTFFDKSFELSAGYIRNSLRPPEGDTVNGNGLAVSVGKIFHIAGPFTTTTSVGGNYTFLDLPEDFPDFVNASYGAYDIGLYQRLAYNISVGMTVIRPFIEAGFSIGTMKSSVNYTYNDGFDINEIDATGTINFDRYTLGAGVQVALANGLTPFAKLSVSRVQLGSTANSQIKETVNGAVVTDANTETGGGERDLTNTMIYAGIGYVF